MAYLLGVLLQKKYGGAVSAGEIGLPVTESGLDASLWKHGGLGRIRMGWLSADGIHTGGKG